MTRSLALPHPEEPHLPKPPATFRRVGRSVRSSSVTANEASVCVGALVVLPTDVVNAADEWPVFDRAVRSCPVVVVEPVWQGGVAVVV